MALKGDWFQMFKQIIKITFKYAFQIQLALLYIEVELYIYLRNTRTRGGFLFYFLNSFLNSFF